MPKQVIDTDAQQLASVALPQHGGKYSVVGHKFIIDEVTNQLNIKGFTLDKEMYKMNLNGEVAQGVYHLKYGNDPDLGLMFAWANSYDKTMRFRCAIGAYVFVCGNGMIAGDMSNYGRKHVGDAKDEVKDHIKVQIQGAASYYSALIADKDFMKTVTVTEDQVAKLMGMLYFKENILTSSQLIAVKEQYKKPAHDYNAPVDSLWTVYNHITYALKKAHPKTWMEQQKELHALIKAEFFPSAPVVDPNQTNLIDQVNEITAAESVTSEEQVEVPATEDNTLSIENYLGITPTADPEDQDETLEDETHGQVIDNTAEEILSATQTEESFDLPAAPTNVPIIETNVQPENNPESLPESEPTQEVPSPEPELKVEGEEQPESLEEQLIAKAEAEMKELTGAEEVNITLKDPVKPLEEQVAMETVQPVSEEEKAVSAEPVVNEEDKVSLTDGEGGLQPNTSFENETSTQAEELDFDALGAQDNSDEGKLESPEFEF